MVVASVVFTIYCHQHIESGRRYVGQTKKTWKQRWNQHVYTALNEKSGWSHFANAIRKYGKDAFSHEVLDVCSDLESANIAEKKWIAHFDTRNPEKGFNIKSGGDHRPHPVINPWDRPGFRENHPSTISACFTPTARAAQLASMRSPESKAKRSAKTKASLASPETRAKRAALLADPAYTQKISNTLKKSLSTPEAKARLSKASRESATPEVNAKRSAAIRTAFQDPAVQERHRAAVTEAQNRPEVLAKHANRVVSLETRQKISTASTGFRHSEESKADMKRQFAERRDRLLAESGCATWSDYIRLSIKRKQSVMTY